VNSGVFLHNRVTTLDATWA